MTVAFIGHRKITETNELKDMLTKIVTNLIVNENADTFLFGSKSQFDNLCYQIVSQLKQTYPYISRIYVRAEYEYIDKSYSDYLLKFFEKTYFPKEVSGAGTMSYIKRNQVMIDNCDVVVAFYDKDYLPKTKRNKTNSGTKIAINYAAMRKRRIINIFECI